VISPLAQDLVAFDLSAAKDVIGGISAAAAATFALFAIVVAFRSGLLRRVRFGAFEIEAGPREKKQARALIDAVVRPQEMPFETEQLAQYYSQVLAQSKTSFWFSLIFASLGFAVIVIASFLYSSSTSGATIAQITAGLIMDAVSALFFVQSKNAQTAMGEFFDKLRRDREQAESRKLCESLESTVARDALRIELALYYAGIKDSSAVSKSILNDWLASHEPAKASGEGKTD
jgi:hypothetical protein